MADLNSELHGRVAEAPVARLGTIRPDGTPHLVPITFDLRDGSLVTAIDHKPKRTTELQRLANIEANPRVAVIVDHYEDDWSRLWWARADGRARVLRDGPQRDGAVDRLVAKYRQYRDQRPEGPVIDIHVDRWTSWSA